MSQLFDVTTQINDEIWKDIKDYEGIYQVSNLGRVKSCDRCIRNSRGVWHIKEKILKCSKRNDGYIMVALRYNGDNRRILVHRLVAEAFIPNPNNLPLVNHKDESRDNNKADNLEWCTNEYNLHYGTADERWLQSQHNKRLSEEHKRKLKAANIGPLNPNYGKKLSLEHKKALSDGAKRYWKEWKESK